MSPSPLSLEAIRAELLAVDPDDELWREFMMSIILRLDDHWVDHVSSKVKAARSKESSPAEG